MGTACHQVLSGGAPVGMEIARSFRFKKTHLWTVRDKGNNCLGGKHNRKSYDPSKIPYQTI